MLKRYLTYLQTIKTQTRLHRCTVQSGFLLFAHNYVDSLELTGAKQTPLVFHRFTNQFDKSLFADRLCTFLGIAPHIFDIIFGDMICRQFWVMFEY